MAKLFRNIVQWLGRREADRQKKQCAITLAAKRYDLNQICINCGNVACAYYRYAKKHGFFESVLDINKRAEIMTAEDLGQLIETTLQDDPTRDEEEV